MAIEGVALAAVAKEAAAKAAVEAAKQIAQKMAGEVSGAGVEMQAADFERQVAQEGFRIGEMDQPGVEELVMYRASQECASSDLSQKMTDVPDGHQASESDVGLKNDGAAVSDGRDTIEDPKQDAASDNVEKSSPADVDEGRKTGGTYGELKGEWGGNLENADPPREIHHMPANSANGLETSDGPAILMEKGDHQETASWGNSKEAREYRQKQEELVKQGKFEEAMQMDIDDIHDKFGDKYDDAIAQMKEVAKEKGLI